MPEIRIDGFAYVALAAGVLFLPLSWLAAALVAGAVHECFHFLMAKRCRISCYSLRIDMGGAVLQMQPMTRREELLISLAGPCGSLLLLFFLRIWPQLAVCGLAQGIFNLLPVYPLDGGRIARCLLGRGSAYVERFALVWVMLGGILCSCGYHMGMLPFFLAGAVTGKAIQRKFPCKAAKDGVQ